MKGRCFVTGCKGIVRICWAHTEGGKRKVVRACFDHWPAVVSRMEAA